jgi:hypothetical protein
MERGIRRRCKPSPQERIMVSSDIDRRVRFIIWDVEEYLKLIFPEEQIGVISQSVGMGLRVHAMVTIVRKALNAKGEVIVENGKEKIIEIPTTCAVSFVSSWEYKSDELIIHKFKDELKVRVSSALSSGSYKDRKRREVSQKQ